MICIFLSIHTLCGQTCINFSWILGTNVRYSPPKWNCQRKITIKSHNTNPSYVCTWEIQSTDLRETGQQKDGELFRIKIAVEWHKTSANVQNSFKVTFLTISRLTLKDVFSPDIFLGVFLITSHYYQVGTWITFVKFQFHKAPKMAEITSAEVQLNDPLWSFLASELWQKKMYQRSGIPKHTSNPHDDPTIFLTQLGSFLCRFHIDMAGGGKRLLAWLHCGAKLNHGLPMLHLAL